MNIGNTNPPQKNPISNIQNISVDWREPNIVVMKRGGVATEADREEPYGKPRV